MANNYTTTIVTVEFAENRMESDGNFLPCEWQSLGQVAKAMVDSCEQSPASFLSGLMDVDFGTLKGILGMEGPWDPEDDDAWFDINEAADNFLGETENMFETLEGKLPKLKSLTVTQLYTCSSPRPFEHGCWVSSTVRTENGLETFSVGDCNLADMILLGQLD